MLCTRPAQTILMFVPCLHGPSVTIPSARTTATVARSPSHRCSHTMARTFRARSYPFILLPTETNVESGTSQSQSGTSVNLGDSGISDMWSDMWSENPTPFTLNLNPTPCTLIFLKPCTLHPEPQRNSTVSVGVPEDSSVVVLGRSRRQFGRGRR